jgi:hypothetical protein
VIEVIYYVGLFTAVSHALVWIMVLLFTFKLEIEE